MALVSKKTFRKWAKALTDRGLTMEGVELMAEFGNTVKFKMRRPIGNVYTIEDNLVSFPVGAVWFDGSIATIEGGKKPGDIVTLPFEAGNINPKVIYCEVNFSCVPVANKIVSVGAAAPEDYDFFTAIRLALGGVDVDDFASFGLIDKDTWDNGFEPAPGDPVESYKGLHSMFDQDTGDTVPGFLRKAVATLTWVPADPPQVPTGFWSAADESAEQNPFGIIWFNSGQIAGEDNGYPTSPSIGLY
jgi:hypothetical protein